MNPERGTVSQVATGGVGTASPTTGGTAGAGTTQTTQTQQIDPSEFARLQTENAALQREAAKVKGMQPFIESARQYGFKEAKDFQRWGPAIQTLDKQGIDPQTLAGAFAQVKEDKPDQSASATIKDMEAMFDQKLSAREKDWVRKQAEKERDSQVQSELESLEGPDADKALGEDAPDSLKALAKYARMGKWFFESRKPYGADHPLANTLGGAGKDGIEAINKFITEQVTGLRAHQWKKLGAAARNPSVSTVAGSGPHQGEPKPSEQRKVSGVVVPSKDEIQAAYEQMKARRSTA